MKKIVMSLAVVAVLVGAAFLSGSVSAPRSPRGSGRGVLPPGGGDGRPTVVANGALTLESGLSNTHLTKGSDGMLYLNLLLKAREADAAASRLPLDLVLVVDRSGSMGEAGKIEYARAAAATVVDHLASTDRLGIVIYDDIVETVAPLGPVENRPALKERIAGIFPRGATDLAAGLARGIDLVPSPEGSARLARVILLSDGLANRGITDPGAIARMTLAASQRGVRVTSLGLGAEFNEDLMLKLAQSGGGSYHFVESPTQMAALFEQEVGAVLKTVARNLTVRVDPASGTTVSDVFGHPFDRSGMGIVIPVPDLSGGETHSLTVRLKVPTDGVGSHEVASVQVSYDGALGGGGHSTLLASMSATCTEDASLVAANEKKDVVSEGLEDEAARELDGVARNFEVGDKKAADARLGRLIERLETENQRLNAPALAEQAKGLRAAQASFAHASPTSDAGKVLVKKAKEESYRRQNQQAQ